MSPPLFDAFISYSHAADGKLAPELQAIIARFAKPWYRRRALRVFRDETTLDVTPELWPTIERALTQSRYFILLASPAAAASKWVQREVERWVQLGRTSKLLIVLTDGTVTWDDALKGFDWTRTNALPRIISGAMEVEPLYVDLSWARKEQQVSAKDPRFHNAAARLAARIHGLSLDDLIGEDVRQYKATIRIVRAAVGLLTTLALIAASAAWHANNQRKVAEKQTLIAQEQTSRALYQVYLNTVRLAAEKISAGDFNKGRQLLLECPREHRSWEWWYLIARCGPAPIQVSKLSALGDPSLSKLLADVKSKLDTLAAKETSEAIRVTLGKQGDPLTLEYDAYRGRGGTTWHIWRGAGTASILLNGYYTGIYGGIPGASLDIPGCVSWRVKTGEERSNPIMASGEIVSESGDYLAAIRERYIVGPLGSIGKAVDPNIEEGHAVDTRTWADEQIPDGEALKLAFHSENPNLVLVTNPKDGTEAGRIDVTSSEGKNVTIKTKKNVTSRQEQGLLASLTNTVLREIASEEMATLSETDKEGYSIGMYNGALGPVVLSSWGYGNIRLRDAKKALLIGESLRPRLEEAKADDFLSPSAYGGRNTVVPGTNLVAGWFWWQDKIVAGVLDLENRKLICQLEKAVGDMDYAYTVNASITAAPNGSELAFELFGRNEHLFAVWNAKSGKLVYGHLGDIGSEDTSDDSTIQPPSSDVLGDAHLPTAYGWDPGGRFVVICRPGGITELRRAFADQPFGYLEGVAPSGGCAVQEVGDPKRVRIANAIVDTKTWSTVITLPRNTAISDDGNLAVIQTRKGVCDLVRLGLRHEVINDQSARKLRVPEAILVHQIREHDDKQSPVR